MMAQGRDNISVLRSMRLFFSKVLAAPWDVQMVRREPQVRPLLVLRWVGPRISGGSAYVRDYQRQMEVFAYPAPVVDGEAYRNQMEAERTLNMLMCAVDSGHAAASSKALRVPLYDYTNVSDIGFLPSGAAPLDYLVLSNLDGQVQQDPETDDLFSVLLDFRVNWSDDGDRSRYEGPPLISTGIQYQQRTPVGKSVHLPYSVGA